MTTLLPFRDGDTYGTFRNLLDNLHREINSLDNSYVLKGSPTELENYFTEKGIIAPLRLHTNQWAIENQHGVAIDVSGDLRYGLVQGEGLNIRGTQLEIGIPYEGDPVLWKLRPSKFLLGGYPEISIHPDRIILSIRFPDATAERDQLKRDIDSKIQLLASAVETLERDVENHNTSVPPSVKGWLATKRERAEKALSIVDSLGIPIKRRDTPATLNVPVQRKRIELHRPLVAAEPFKPEPVLQDVVYEEILKSLRSMSLVIERNPHSFQRIDEERLRDQFLINLNSLFEGQATGETFNGSGKTDILIRVEDRTVFIAECKFWTGPAKFGEAIDQLLSYLTWRDCKCALLVFNRNKDSAAVHQKMHEVMGQRKEYRKTLFNTIDTGGRYVFVKEAGREIIISTLLFDIPT